MKHPKTLGELPIKTQLNQLSLLKNMLGASRLCLPNFTEATLTSVKFFLLIADTDQLLSAIENQFRHWRRWPIHFQTVNVLSKGRKIFIHF